MQSHRHNYLAAAQAVHAGGANGYQRAFVVRYNREINLLAIKGIIPDATYLWCQNLYESVLRERLENVTARQGREFDFQQRRPGQLPDGGTDADVNTDARSPEQVRQLQHGLNDEFTDYFRQAAIHAATCPSFGTVSCGN